MQIAVKDSQRSRAYKGAKGYMCPGCEGDVVSKCGDKYIHHWAHLSGKDCDTWSEPEGEWHLKWKENFPNEWLEVVMGENREHRADIRRPDGLVIELQHSQISYSEACERCEFYGKIIWIFDAHDYIGRCSVLSWFGEYPHWKSVWYGNGRANSKLTLTKPHQICIQNEVFHSVENKAQLPSAVAMKDAPVENKDVHYWRLDMDKAEKRIHYCQERLLHFRGNAKKEKDWTGKLKDAEASLIARNSAVCFLKQPMPANNSKEVEIDLGGTKVSGVPIRIKWSRPRQAFSELTCPFLWDFDNEYILLFPKQSKLRQVKPYLDSVLLKKATVIKVLQNRTAFNPTKPNKTADTDS